MSDLPTRIRSVELRVSDVEASADFYAALLGLEPTGLGLREGALRVPGAEARLVELRRAETPGRAPAGAAGLFHTAFRFRTRAGLAAALRRLGAAGWALTGASDHGVSEALYLDDPDGLGIELYRDRPVDRWPRAEAGERVRMFTAPLDLDDLLAEPEHPAGDAEGIARDGLDIGHVHLKVADTEAAIRFWVDELGFELMSSFGTDAGFLATGAYHHHVGVNSWRSRGAELEPASGPGISRVELLGRGPAAGTELRTPDGLEIAFATA